MDFSTKCPLFLSTVAPGEYLRINTAGTKIDGVSWFVPNQHSADPSSADLATYGKGYAWFNTTYNVAKIWDGTNILIVGSDFFYPETYGAIGDGSTNDYAAIQACFDAAYASVADGSIDRAVVYFRSKSGYASASALTCKAGIDIDMQSPIIYTGSSNEVALTIGESASYNNYPNLRIKVRRSAQADWTSEDSVGVRIYNAVQGNINIPMADYFTVGIQPYGDAGKGVMHNTFTIGMLSGNKYNLDLVGGSSSGVVNENIFIGGEYQSYTGCNVGENRYGVRIRSTGTYQNNNNIFIKPSFEMKLTVATPGVAIPFLITHGSYNTVIGARSEGNSTTFASISALCYGNRFEVSAGVTAQASAILSDATVSKSNVIKYGGYIPSLSAGIYPIFDSGPIHKKAGHYGTNAFYIPGVSIQPVTTTHAIASSVPEANSTSATTYFALNSSYAMGVYVDTSVVKSFVIRKDCVASFEGRLAISAWDSSGTQLTSAGANHPYIQAMANGAEYGTYSTSYGGSYVMPNDTISQGSLYFSVHDDVAKIYIMLAPGTAALRIRSFQVYSADTQGRIAAVWSGISEPTKGARLSSASPTKWAWLYSVGDYTFNSAPASAAASGWSCAFRLDTTLGGDESTGDDDMLLANATGIEVGDIIGITLTSGTVQWSTVDDIAAAPTISMAANLTGDAASGNAVYVMRHLPWANLP